MKKAILATKVGMTQIFAEDGSLIPVTVLQAGPCVVTQIKTIENDGYEAVQVGFVDKKDKIINKDASGKKEIVHAHGTTKAMQGHFKKAGVTSKRYVREFKFENASEYALAQEIKADIFAEGDKIDATVVAAAENYNGDLHNDFLDAQQQLYTEISKQGNNKIFLKGWMRSIQLRRENGCHSPTPTPILRQ